MAYTTTEFLVNVKTRAAVPTSQSTFTVSKILSLADDEIRTYILPMLSSKLEYYYAYDDERAVNASGIYDVHTRAVGGSLINVALLDSTNRVDVAWVTEDRLIRTDNTNEGILGCYLKRNQLVLLPPDAHGFSTLRMTILLRPGQLVETTTAAQITGISSNTLSFASGTIPASFTTSVTYDLIQAGPHFDHLGIDLTASSVTSTTVVLSSTPSSRLAVGDWISLAGTSPVVQVPVEAWPLLCQKTANTLMRAQGDNEGLAAGEKELKRMEEMTSSLFTPRIKKEGKKLVIRNRILRRR